VADEFIESGGGEEEEAAESGAEKGVKDGEGYVEGELRGGVVVKIGEREGLLKASNEHLAGGIVGGDASGEGEANAQAEEGDGVREEPDAEVGGDENDEQTAEEEPLEGWEGDAEAVPGEDEESAG
jgi:hypothetical protein